VAGVLANVQILGMHLVETSEIPGSRGRSSNKNFLGGSNGLPHVQIQRHHPVQSKEDVPTKSSTFSDRILRVVARCRLQLESLLKGWALPTTAFTMVLGLMIYGLVEAFKPGRSLQEAGSMIGIITFSGTFLLASIGVGMWLGRWPEQTREELLLDMTRTRQSRWRTALLSETEIWIRNRTAKRNARLAARAEKQITLNSEAAATNTAEGA